jgi:hypothetical protein
MPFFGVLILVIAVVSLFGCAVWFIVKGQKRDRSYTDESPPDVSAGGDGL